MTVTTAKYRTLKPSDTGRNVRRVTKSVISPESDAELEVIRQLSLSAPPQTAGVRVHALAR